MGWLKITVLVTTITDGDLGLTPCKKYLVMVTTKALEMSPSVFKNIL